MIRARIEDAGLVELTEAPGIWKDRDGHYWFVDPGRGRGWKGPYSTATDCAIGKERYAGFVRKSV